MINKCELFMGKKLALEGKYKEAGDHFLQIIDSSSFLLEYYTSARSYVLSDFDFAPGDVVALYAEYEDKK